MDEIVRQIKNQQEINFLNVRDQILNADLNVVFDNENHSRYIFHYLHSLDRFFINPCDYVYEGEKLFGISENLSIINPNHQGYVDNPSIAISQKQLLDYFEYVKAKIDSYFETLTEKSLLEKPKDCEYPRLELILSQFRHLMWHVGVSSAITYTSKKEWNKFTGLTALNDKLFAERNDSTSGKVIGTRESAPTSQKTAAEWRNTELSAGWRDTSISDLPLLQKTAENNGLFANNYSAVNCVLYQKKFQSQITEKDGWLFERYTDCPCKEKKNEMADGDKQFSNVICYSFPHKIEGSGLTNELKSAIEFIVEGHKNCPCKGESKNPSQNNESSGEANNGISDGAHPVSAEQKFLIFSNVTLQEKDALLALFPSAEVISTPESGDYIYRTEKLSGLAGKKLSRKRNHISQFKKKYPDYSFEILTEKNLSLAYKIEEAWLSENEKEEQNPERRLELRAEKELIFTALDNFSTFSETCGMTGGILFANGKPAAFCIASRLSNTVTDVHFEKCLSTFALDGGYSVITNEFSKTVRTDLINREEDLGIEGLRKAKLSWYPESVVEKFRVIITP